MCATIPALMVIHTVGSLQSGWFSTYVARVEYLQTHVHASLRAPSSLPVRTYVHMCMYAHHRSPPQPPTLGGLDAGTHSMASLSLEYCGLWIISGSTSICRGSLLK